MPPRKSTNSPQLEPIRFGQLADGDPVDLAGGADLEALHFKDVVLPRLNLPGSAISEVRFHGLNADTTVLTGARLRDVEMDRLNLPVVNAARSQWRDVTVTGRLGSVEAYGSTFRSVHFVGCKISFMNLRGAELLDVAFTDCVIDELDLVESKVRRVRLTGTRVSNLNVQNSVLQDFDLRQARLETVAGVMQLRGATVSPLQLSLLAPLFAQELGIKVED